VSDAAVQFSKDDDVLRITLDRPARKNALDPTAVRSIIAELEAVAQNDSARAILITGNGADFCTGADLVAANEKKDDKPRTGNLQRRTGVQAHRLIELLVSIQLPVVCGVRGNASGLGCQLALAADFAIAAEDATFWEPFIARGFTPDSAATWLLPRLVGVARAKEMLLLGDKVSGEQAAAWGLVHRAVPDAELDAAAEDLARRLAAGPTVAIGLAKRCLQTGLEQGIAQAMEKEALALELSSRTRDFREGLTAFKERREPKYEGR